MVRSIGADHVVDYTKEDYTRSGERYDVILDNVVNRPLLANRRILKPDGKYVLIGGGGPEAGAWVGPFAAPVKALVLSRFVSQEMSLFMAELKQTDLAILSDLMRAGKVTPVIDRSYRLDQIAEAMRHLEAGHARGKIVIDME